MSGLEICSWPDFSWGEMPEPGKCRAEGCTLTPQKGALLQGHFATDEPDQDVIRNFVKEFGQEVDIEGHYINFDSGMHFPLQAAQTAAANNAVLFIKIEPFSGKRIVLDNSDYLGEINKGTFDQLFIAIGREIRKFGKPVMLTFGHEMNMEKGGGGAYQWTGLQRAEKFKKAFTRVHDLISGPEEEGQGGANNVLWVLNFDAGVYHRLYRTYGHNPEKFAEYINNRLDKFTPNKEYFDIVAVDGYVNDYSSSENRGEAKDVIYGLFNPIFSAIAKNPKLKDKDLFVGEFGVSSTGVRMTEKRKGQLLTAFLDYLAEFNTNPENPKDIIGYLYFDLKKGKFGGGDEGDWKIESVEAKQAYHEWLTTHAELFKNQLFFSQKDTKESIEFQGPEALPVPEAKIDLTRLPEKQIIPYYLSSWDQLVSPPVESVIGKFNDKLGLALLDRWLLEEYFDREKDAGKKLMGPSPYQVGDFDVEGFKKDYENYENNKKEANSVYKLLEKNGITSDATAEQLMAEFNKLIKIPKLEQLINDKKNISPAQSGKADAQTIVKNKQKLAQIYPHTLEKSQLMEAGIEAFSKITPETPLIFSVSPSSFENFEELLSLRNADKELPANVNLFPYFDNPKAYWENATTFVSVYAQKAIEAQDKERIEKAVQVCELLIRRFENQMKLEAKVEEKTYAYPTHHNLALLKLTLADARSQLKTLDEKTYQESIAACLEAIQLFQKLEKSKNEAPIPSGADYFSIAKAVITIGDLKVRIAQIYTRNMGFEKADLYFREAETLYQSVANLDAGRKKGLTIDMEVLPGKRLKLEVKIESMLNSWQNNLSLGYIRYQDKLRGFQGTCHFLKALASIKIQGAFLENPIKKPEDYIIGFPENSPKKPEDNEDDKKTTLFDRLALLQNSFEELTRDPELKVDFLKGLAVVTKANFLTMIGDRAQYDTSAMDRASAMEYFNRTLTKLSQTIPELDPSIIKLQEKAKFIIASIQRTRKANDEVFIIDDNILIETSVMKSSFSSFGNKQAPIWEALVKAGYIDGIGIIQPKFDGVRETFNLNNSSGLSAEELSQVFVILQQTVDKPMTPITMIPFTKTAGASKRFALIMTNLVGSLAEEVYELSQPSEEEEGFPYLFMSSNLLQADMAVRYFYITNTRIDVNKNYKWIKVAREHMKGTIIFGNKEDEPWKALIKTGYIDGNGELLPKFDQGNQFFDLLLQSKKEQEEFENWSRFQANYQEANLLVLENEKEDMPIALRRLDSALKELEKFICPSQVFYKAQIYLLQAEALIRLRRYKDAKNVVDNITSMLPKIEMVSKDIGWDLQNFKVRYSRLLIKSIKMGFAQGRIRTP